MPCPSEHELRAMLAGELSVENEQEIVDHLLACEACEALADALSVEDLPRELPRRQNGEQAEEWGAQLVQLRHRLADFAAAPESRSFLPPELSQPRNDDSTPRSGSSTLAGLTVPPPPTAEDEQRPNVLGPFEIVRLRGAGAFGFVYEAIDRRLGRKVALKLARSNVLADPDLKSRFLREAEALARLDHPNIVPVFEVGQQRGAGDVDSTCYLAIALCNGPTLADWLEEREHPVEPELAARIVLTLAEAVAHAHSRQILHRDIKPANVLLDGVEPEGSLPFIPRLTDFGLARIAESPSQATLGGLVLGTPQYMAPEQAAGHVERIGPTTDVYALGAVLYELLTRRPPITGNTPVDTLRHVLIDDPPPVRRLNPSTPEDLDAIAMKCLEKSPGGRYPSAAALADDLRRFLAGRPTQARPLGAIERSARWVQRNRLATAAAILVALVLALSAGIVFYDQRLKDVHSVAKATRQRTTELEEKIKSSDQFVDDLAYANGIRTAAQSIEEGDLSQAAEALRAYIPGKGEADRRCLAWHYLWSRTAHASQAEIDAGTQIYQVCLSPDGSQLAAAGQDGIVRIYDPQTARLRRTIAAGQGEINGVAFDPSGKFLASAGDDGTVKVWRLKDRKAVREVRAAPSHAYDAAFVGNSSSLLAIGREPDLLFWKSAAETSPRLLAGHTEAIETFALSPSGRWLATGGSDRSAIIWSTADWRPVHHLKGAERRISGVAFSPDESHLAIAAHDNRVRIIEVASGACVALGSHLDSIQSVTFSHDGQQLITGDRAGTIRSWSLPPLHSERIANLAEGTSSDAWHGHNGRVWSLAALPDGQFLSSGGDGLIRTWGRGNAASTLIPKTNDDPYRDICAAADGKTLFAARRTLGVVAIDPLTGKELFALPILMEKFSSLETLDELQLLAAGTEEGQLAIWNIATRELESFEDIGQGRSIDTLEYSAAARRLAIRCDPDSVWIMDPPSREITARLPAESNNALAFSPDGRRIAVDTMNYVAIFEVESGRAITRFPAHPNTITSLAWSPDGSTIATASADRTVRLWTPSGEPIATLTGHRHLVSAVAYSPDGRILVSGDQVGIVRLTHAATKRFLCKITTHSPYVRQIIAWPDGRRIAIRGMPYDIAVIGAAAAGE